MNSVEIIGLVAGVLTTVAFLPQVILVYRTRHTRDISLGMFSLFTAGIALWLVYGILTRAVPVIAANGVTFFLSLYILIMKLKWG